MIHTSARSLGNNDNILAFVTCCIAIVFVSFLCIQPVAGTQYIVAPSGGEFTSIQNAITWASAQDTIVVRSGTYPGTVRIDKKITLIGVNTGGGAPVIDPGKTGSAININADGCAISGFTIQNSALNGIAVNSNANIIQNNTIAGNSVGILISSSNSNSITGNRISANTRAAIVLRNAQSNLIEGNVITKNTLGLSIDEQSSANTIFYNTFSNTENVQSRGLSQTWTSSSTLSYVYLGKSFVGNLGNYWSDYQGGNQNGDGIGDTAYLIRGAITNGNGNPGTQTDVDPAPLMDPIEYYSQIRPTSLVAGSTLPTPSVQPGNPILTPTQNQPGDTGSPLIPWSDRFFTIIVVLIIIICVAGGGAVLFLRYRSTQSHKLEAGSVSSTATNPQIVPVSSVKVDTRQLEIQPDTSAAKVTTPAPETEGAPGNKDSSPITGPKFYFPPELEGRYSDIRHIGRGGVAQVFAAYRKSDNLLIAVKIPISFDEVTGKCFLNEIAAWQTLRHNNIVEVLEVNILPVPYVEMEYVSGSLETIQKPLPVWKAVHLVHGIADGLAYAHAHGIIHRDIKPHNILVTGDFVPKITDWGMSKVIATTMDKSSVAGFSLSYAAPEQVSPAEFGRTDIRTDIYQLGALFYELVTGSIPFGGESIVEVGNAIVREDPIPPTEYNPDAEVVEKIILKCLAKNPADRYQSADELLDALSRYLDEDSP